MDFSLPILGQNHFPLLWLGIPIIHTHLAITKHTRQPFVFLYVYFLPGQI